MAPVIALKPWVCWSTYCRKCQLATQTLWHRGNKATPQCPGCKTPLYVVGVVRTGDSMLEVTVDWWDAPLVTATSTTSVPAMEFFAKDWHLTPPPPKPLP